MPAAGTTRLPKTKKARIIAEKQVGIGTSAEIAKRHKVAHSTVRNLVSSPPAEILPLVEKYRARLDDEAVEVTGRAFDEMKRRLTEAPQAETTKNLVAMAKIGYETHRLETNQPTSITQHQRSPFEMAVEFAKLLLSKHPDPSEAKMLFGYANTARVGIGASEEEWKQVEAQVFG